MRNIHPSCQSSITKAHDQLKLVKAKLVSRYHIILSYTLHTISYRTIPYMRVQSYLTYLKYLSLSSVRPPQSTLLNYLSLFPMQPNLVHIFPFFPSPAPNSPSHDLQSAPIQKPLRKINMPRSQVLSDILPKKIISAATTDTPIQMIM